MTEVNQWGEIELDIPDQLWHEHEEENDLRDGPLNGNHLYATLVINGVHFHLDAWAVHVDGDGFLRAVDPDYEENLDHLHAAATADGHFQTLTIRGRDYVVHAAPFC